ncbi:MAG: SDR family NAD(P)-dependent oxidoreductase [Verrucomicrobiota bacterium]|nr:SDR family NAD(P)-dependent oxidoreductase [Verrucomicrobiota bacterium]
MPTAVAVITGGEGDLARAIADELRARGATVHAPARDLLEVASPQSITHFFGTLPRIDLLVNNAGIRADITCAKMAEAQWDSVLKINLRGAFLCAQAVAAKMMKQRSGHILNVGSFSALFGNAGQTNYAAAKAGIIGLTQSMARELGRRNVRVNCVLPGYLETKFTSEVAPGVQEQIREMHELRQFNTPAEAARFIAFLETMPFVSGQVFQLDSRIARWT